MHARPCTTALIMAARAKLIDADSDAGARTTALLREFAILAIDAWEGIGDDAGEAALVSPEAIAAIMDIWPFAEAFERVYLGPAMVLDDEKKRLTALARWHFGDGPQYCGGCHSQGRPCASGKRRADGSRCPEFAVCEKRLKRAERFRQAARDREAACAYRMRQVGGG